MIDSRRMEVEQQLRSAVARHAKERDATEQRLAEIERRRDDAIRAAAAAGLTRRQIAAIASAVPGARTISYQRVQQIVRNEQRAAA